MKDFKYHYQQGHKLTEKINRAVHYYTILLIKVYLSKLGFF